MTCCKYLKSFNKTELEAFIDSFDVVLSDCDGVLWQETEAIKGSPETVKKFKELGKRFFYITNNNCKTREELVNKCTSHGYKATVNEILCSSYLAAVYLKRLKFNKTVYVVGSEGISQELSAQGIKNFGVGPEIMKGDELDILLNFKRNPEVGAVVVGFDKHFSYPKLVKAATYLKDPQVHFIGTNPDVERPSPNGSRYPGAGCFINCIQAISGRKATVVGKPEPFVNQVIMERYGVDPARTLMIGDNLNTDILLGKRCGFTTLLVLSGLTSSKDVEKLKMFPELSITPDFYTDRLSDVFCTYV